MRGWTGALVLGLVVAGGDPLVGQERGWRVSANVGGMTANGEFSAVRPNGKRITSDISGGFYLALAVARHVGDRWRIFLGYEGSPSATFTIDQAFPDSTSFSSSDTFSYNALTAGAAFDAVSQPSWFLRLAPYLAYGWFSNVSLAGAGPPFDRTAPLDITVDSRLGFGFSLSALARVGSGWTVGGRGGMTIQRFQGTFPEDPSMPGTAGDVDVAFNPLYLTAEVGFAF